MPKYTFVVEGTISLHTDVEADSLDEAVEIARSRGVMSLCYQCARSQEDEWATSGELDCEPGALIEAWEGDTNIDGDDFDRAAEAFK